MSAATVLVPEHAPTAPRKQRPKAKRMARVTQIARRWHLVSPVIKSLEPEILQRWENGTLTRSLAREYQTDREVIEFMVWRAASPMLRAARLAAAPLLCLVGLQSVEAAVSDDPTVQIVRVKRGRRGRRRNDEYYRPAEFRTEEVRRLVCGAAGEA